MSNLILQDTITLPLQVEKTATNTTVKISAKIVAMIEAGTKEDSWRAEMRAAAKKFINITKANGKEDDEDAGWAFSGLSRKPDASGYEKLEITISGRVPESENYNLDIRAKEAGRTGLQIVSPQTDVSLPQYQIDATISDLRAELITLAHNECEKLSGAMKRKLRIHQINFFDNDMPNLISNSASNVRSYGATMSAGSEAGGGNRAMGNSAKISLSATVVFAIMHASLAGDGSLKLIASNESEGASFSNA